MKKIIRMLICVQLLLVLIAQTVFAQDTGKGADIQSKKNYGSIIFFVGLTLPRYRFSKPSASLDMNLR